MLSCRGGDSKRDEKKRAIRPVGLVLKRTIATSNPFPQGGKDDDRIVRWTKTGKESDNDGRRSDDRLYLRALLVIVAMVHWSEVFA